VQAKATADLKAGAGIGELWAGVLVGPTAMLMQLEINYALVPWACGTGHTWPLHVVSLFALVVTVAAGFLAYRIWRRVPTGEDSGGALARSRFMAAVGVLISLLMALVIVAQWLPVFFHSPCER
jgi:RsiW-degrading membrane proteinase PrsW (M82 family)